MWRKTSIEINLKDLSLEGIVKTVILKKCLSINTLQSVFTDFIATFAVGTGKPGNRKTEIVLKLMPRKTGNHIDVPE